MQRSIVSSRALVAPGQGFGGRPLVAPWWRSLVGHALLAGAVRWRVRGSGRSFTGAVVVLGFDNCGTAVAFGSAWAWWVGCALALRKRTSQGRTVWAVSVPVHWPGGRGSAQGGRGGQFWWLSD